MVSRTGRSSATNRQGRCSSKGQVADSSSSPSSRRRCTAGQAETSTRTDSRTAPPGGFSLAASGGRKLRSAISDHLFVMHEAVGKHGPVLSVIEVRAAQAGIAAHQIVRILEMLEAEIVTALVADELGEDGHVEPLGPGAVDEAGLLHRDAVGSAALGGGAGDAGGKAAEAGPVEVLDDVDVHRIVGHRPVLPHVAGVVLAVGGGG